MVDKQALNHRDMDTCRTLVLPCPPSQSSGASSSSSDVLLYIDLMAVEALACRLSFRSDPAARPRWATHGALALGLDLAQLDNLQLDLPGGCGLRAGVY